MQNIYIYLNKSLRVHFQVTVFKPVTPVYQMFFKKKSILRKNQILFKISPFRNHLLKKSSRKLFSIGLLTSHLQGLKKYSLKLSYINPVQKYGVRMQSFLEAKMESLGLSSFFAQRRIEIINL